jgi:hypothetical protein
VVSDDQCGGTVTLILGKDLAMHADESETDNSQENTEAMRDLHR